MVSFIEICINIFFLCLVELLYVYYFNYTGGGFSFGGVAGSNVPKTTPSTTSGGSSGFSFGSPSFNANATTAPAANPSSTFSFGQPQPSTTGGSTSTGVFGQQQNSSNRKLY